MAASYPNAGVDFRPEDHIYKFTRLVFGLEDRRNGVTRYYPVASIRFTITMNQIPTMTVAVAPQGFSDLSEVTANLDSFVFTEQPEPLQPTFLDFVQEYRILQEGVLRGDMFTTLQLELARRDRGDIQRVDINDWIPTEVAINSSGASGSFLLSLTSQHPAYRTSTSIGWIPNTADSMNAPESFILPEDEGGIPSDIPGIFVNDKKIYLEKSRNLVTGFLPDAESGAAPLPETAIECDVAENPSQSLEAVSEAALDSLEESLDAFIDTLEWNALGGNDLPFDGRLVTTYPERYFGRLLWYTAGTPSPPWQTFIQTLGDYDLAISGDPSDDPLQITPFAPWGRYSMILYDGEISSVQMPGMGKRDVSGVITGYNDGPVNDFDTSVYIAFSDGNSVVNTPQMTTLGGYVCPLLEEPVMLGPLLYRNPPAWLREYYGDQSGDYGTDGVNNPMGRTSVNANVPTIYNETAQSTAPEPQVPEERSVGYSDMINKWSEQVFLRMYKSDDAISINTRLLLATPSSTTPRNFVRPGIVVKIVSTVFPEGEEPSAANVEERDVLYFYATQVIHEIVPGSKTARSALTGTYVRFADDIEEMGVTAEDIDAGLKNPIYDTVGAYSNEDNAQGQTNE